MINFHKKELSNISNKAEIGDGCIIHSHVVIYDDVKIGKNCKIQSGVFIPNGVRIGDNVFIGPNTVFTNDLYPPSDGQNWQSTFVHDNASIGANATILPGVYICENSIVGAGAVVTRNVPPNTTVVGNPAKPICKKSHFLKRLLTKLKNWL